MIEEQKEALSSLREDGLALPQFTFSWDDECCNTCGAPLAVRLTRQRKIISTTYGSFQAIERQGYCPEHPGLPPARSRELPRIVAPGSNHAYDVIAEVGFARFIQCRQIEEIRNELARHHKIEVRSSTVSHLARKFVAYFQVVHQESRSPLRAAMHQRGGYILHVDGSCEEGSRVLLVCMDSLSGQVLESRKISSENHEEVKGVLKDVLRDWGSPLAVVHDLRKALISAVGEVFDGVPQFICHYHLAADVGKDILGPHADRLRRLFRLTKVRPKLRALVRSLKVFAISQETGDLIVTSILRAQSKKKLQTHCTPETVKGAVHALASWILAYSQDGEGYGFPFDMPYLNLYERILKVHDAVNYVRAIWPDRKRGPLGTFTRFAEILDSVVTDTYAAEFRQAVIKAKKDIKIFNRFRSALRICQKGGKRKTNEDAPQVLSARRHKRVLKDLSTSLNRQAHRKGPTERACTIVVQHVDKYWNYLFGHVRRSGSRRIVVPRTNNIEEGLFGIVKRQCRRLHGKGQLSRDIEAMSPATPLLINLRNSSYCKTVYGGQEPENIAARFSEVDPKKPAQLLKAWREDRVATKMPGKFAGLKTLPKQVARFLSIAVNSL